MLLLFVIDYNCNLLQIEDELSAYANNGEIIDGFFKPVQKLGEGVYGQVWKGNYNYCIC